jgi:hypothetical protein
MTNIEEPLRKEESFIHDFEVGVSNRGSEVLTGSRRGVRGRAGDAGAGRGRLSRQGDLMYNSRKLFYPPCWLSTGLSARPLGDVFHFVIETQ